MNRIEQGVLYSGKATSLRGKLLILFVLLISYSLPSYADDSQLNVLLLHTPDNRLHNTIAQKLSVTLSYRLDDVDILSTSNAAFDENRINENTLVIAIGTESITTASEKFPRNDKLLIASSPGNIKQRSKKGKDSATLFITQPYCRQISFIKNLNPEWKEIGIIFSKDSTLDQNRFESCASTYDLTAHITRLSRSDKLTETLKQVLSKTELLLAQPDYEIYNSKSVKNILLTSYRMRKPVIAFSKSFSKAGALASIYSTPAQIADTATSLIADYIVEGRHFNQPISFPQEFEISINRQVFRALDIDIPDTEKLKGIIMDSKNTRIPVHKRSWQ